MEGRRIVQGTRVDGVGVVLADLSPEHEPAADRTEVAHGVGAPVGLRPELPCLAAEANSAAREPHERDEPRTGGLPAVGAVAIAGEQRLPLGFVPQRAAETTARVTNPALTH